MVIALLDLETLEERRLIAGGANPRYSSTGHIVYGVEGTLRAVPFDLDRLEVTGDPVPVLEGVTTRSTGAANFSIGRDGSLAYVAGGGSGGQRTIVWVHREGRETPIEGIPPDAYRDVRVSPDGSRVAVATEDDLWIYDVSRETLSRLTTHAAIDRSPLWTRDGTRIVFTSLRAGHPELFWRRADGTGKEERILTRAIDLTNLYASDWVPDGRSLFFSEVNSAVRVAIGQLSIEGGSAPRILVQNEFNNGYATVSPDGGWIAYHSNLSGRFEIYVERYPDLGDRQQISTSGGQHPIWSRDGRELFFRSLDGRQTLTVPIQSGTRLVAGRPEVLFEGAYVPISGGLRPSDLAPDGRFAVIKLEDTDSAPNVILVKNWFEELERLAPGR
jgi:serine/threonine-protein kinase